MSDDLGRGEPADRFVSHPGRDQQRVLRKRFYKEAKAAPFERGFAIELDGRKIKTPAKETLAVPSEALADAIAGEWNAQVEEIDPETMPFTKLANSAIDRVTPQRDYVIDELSGYGSSDLLCYLADGPEPLVERQKEAWMPLLDWLADTHQVRLKVAAGVMFVAQDDAELAKLRDLVAGLSDFGLSGLHMTVTLTGSFVLGFAVASGDLSAEEAHALAHLDETWQAEQWGQDEEQETRLAGKLEALKSAGEFFEHLGGPT